MTPATALLASALAVAGLAVSASATLAGDADAALWARQCAKEADGREQCFVEQYAVGMPAKAVLLNVRFSLVGPERKARMALTAPLGVRLPPGLTLAIDAGGPIALPFDRCDGGGCLAVADIDRPGLDRFRKGSMMTVRFVTGDNKPFDVPIPLTGLDAALTQLTR
ncbi:invasion associated locus B family protein [Azospirillum sp. HJ39]|uniref:invasion associated locus B family protein n=1 Tax=Azospirillum sp. HJ39 TaxID=3159496 RepID=UPI003557684A